MRCNAKDMNPIPKALHIYQMSKFVYIILGNNIYRSV